MAEITKHTTNPGSGADVTDDGHTVVLWTRRPVCGPRTTVIDRLTGLKTKGRIDEVTVQTWPEQLVVSEQSEHDVILDTIERYEQWAIDNGLSLRPPFEMRTASLLVGGSKKVLTTPMMTTAIYEGGDIAGVYPCTDGTRTWTIDEYLERAEAGDGLPHRDGD